MDFYVGTKGYEKLKKALESSGAKVNTKRDISEKELQKMMDEWLEKEPSDKGLYERVKEVNKGEIV